MPRTTDLEHRCPWCHRLNDAVTSPEGHTPAEGDVTICWACRNIAVFVGTPPAELRKPTQDEIDEISRDPNVASLVQGMATASTPLEAAARARREGER